ncbi:MAG: hypothetical protein DMF84_26380 [Acidobacteria bacterium]|nr:MAG: hypothetical protein DMF84_26380 [Acidobacteriota bacterium]
MGGKPGEHFLRPVTETQAKESAKAHPHAACFGKTEQCAKKNPQHVRMSTSFPPLIHMFSTAAVRSAFASLMIVVCASHADAQSSANVTLYRIFLQDGTTLVSYGDYARVADRVVLSVPMGGSSSAPNIQLLTIPASVVDWERTDAYAESARAAHYAVTRGPDDYALLASAVARALSDIAVTRDSATKIAMAGEARQNVTRWVAEHYGYRASDVAQLAGMFDDVIAETRAASGAANVDLALVANMAVPPSMPLMGPPTLPESLEQGLRAATLAEPSERLSLLRAVAATLSTVGPEATWSGSLRARVSAAIAGEERTDRDYATLSRDVLRTADRRARDADVRGVARLLSRVLQDDQRLGNRRPQAIASLLASLDARLDSARRLRLARDQWEGRLDLLRGYSRLISEPLATLRRGRSSLERIRQFEATSRVMLQRLTDRTADASRQLSAVTPPVEGETIQGLLTSAAQLTSRAVSARQRAVASGEMPTAWEAASAAAGAIMLIERASDELQRLTKAPELK